MLHRPWLNGTFGRQINEALAFIKHHVGSDHPLVKDELEHVLFDHDLDPDNPENQAPSFQKRLLLEAPFAVRDSDYVGASASREGLRSRVSQCLRQALAMLVPSDLWLESLCLVALVSIGIASSTVSDSFVRAVVRTLLCPCADLLLSFCCF